MALSIVSIPGDGVTDTFNVSFALGILDRTSVTAWVTGEFDGGGNKVYRTITYLTDTMLKISGAKAGVGVMVVFTRTVSQTNLIVNYEDGDIMNEVNLNTSQKQALMLVHQVLDGRFSAFIQNVSAGGFKITNLGTPTVGTDAATKAYADSLILTGQSNAAAAAASAAAALVSQNAAAASAGAAATSASTALTYSNNSSTFATNSSNSATAAQAANVASYANYTNSLAQANLAQKWATELEDVVVSGGQYSAFHWAQKAMAYVTGSIATVLHAATVKAVPVDADELNLLDSTASFGLRRFTWANIRTALQVAAGFRLGPAQPVGVIDPSGFVETGFYTVQNTSPNVPVVNHGYVMHWTSANGAVGSKGRMQKWVSVNDHTEYQRFQWYTPLDAWGTWLQTRNADGTISDNTLPLRLRSTNAYVTNWDTTLESGFYRGQSTTTGTPVADFTVCLVTAFDANFVVQDITSAASKLHYRRYRTGGVWGSWVQMDSSLTQVGPVALSGAATGFTGIPAWAKEINVLIYGASYNAAGELLIQLGSSAGYVVTGYRGGAWAFGGAGAANSTGFRTMNTAAADIADVVVRLSLQDPTNNIWACTLHQCLQNGSFIAWGVGTVTLPAVLDRVRLTTIPGTPTADAGTISITYA